jgi:putative oxidoreductase
VFEANEVRAWNGAEVDLSKSSKLQPWAAIPLRLIVGYGFMAHGYAKLANGPEHFIGALRALGVPAPALAGWATIAVELVGGACVLAGAFVAFISLPLMAVLLVAAVTVHLPYGFSSIKLQAITNGRAQFGPPGYELDLLYIAALATLALGGCGRFAVDNWLSSGKKQAEARSVLRATA